MQRHPRAGTDVGAQHLRALDALHEQDRTGAQHAQRHALVAAARQILHRPDQPRAEPALLDRGRPDLEDAQPDPVRAGRRVVLDHPVFPQRLQQQMRRALPESQLAGERGQPQRTTLGQEVERANGVADGAEGAIRHRATLVRDNRTLFEIVLRWQSIGCGWRSQWRHRSRGLAFRMPLRPSV